MCNHQNENDRKKDFLLKNNQCAVVRSPKVQDAQALIDYMKAVDSETKFLAREPGEFSLTLEEEENFIKRAMGNENLSFLVCEINNEIAGSCSVGMVNNNRRFKHRAALGISVKKKYWGIGIGKILMQESIEWCRRKGVEQLELEVVIGNERALTMYKMLGFEVQGTKKRAMKYEDGTYADEYQMVLYLNEL